MRTAPLVMLALGVAAVVALLLVSYAAGSRVRLGNAGGTVSVSDAGVHLRHGSSIYFNVTFGSETYLKKLGQWEGAKGRWRTAQAFVVSANTHTGTLKHMSLDGKVFLRVDGVEYPSTGRVITPTTHHNTYLIYFPRYDMRGEPLFSRDEGSFDVLIRDVDVPERVLTFNYPLPADGVGRTLPQLLMLMGSALAALLVACTPCITGSMTLGAITMGAAGEGDWRKRAITRILTFLATLVLTYWLIAIATYTLGLKAEDLRLAEMVGGVVLALTGLVLLSMVLRGMIRLWRAKDEGFALTAGQSSAIGASLAMLCSVAGAPTLSAAVILPLMVYAGLSDWYWAGLILMVYLVVTAMPFFLIAAGLGGVLERASSRWRQRLLAADGVLLIAIGILLVLGQETVANLISIPFRALVATLG